MTTKHTPGPRTLQHRGDLGEYHSLAQGGQVIGIFANRADALLDTASPELLAVLKPAADEIEQHLAWRHPSFAELLGRIRAIIAKAEGSTP